MGLPSSCHCTTSESTMLKMTSLQFKIMLTLVSMLSKCYCWSSNDPVIVDGKEGTIVACEVQRYKILLKNSDQKDKGDSIIFVLKNDANKKMKKGVKASPASPECNSSPDSATSTGPGGKPKKGLHITARPDSPEPGSSSPA